MVGRPSKTMMDVLYTQIFKSTLTLTCISFQVVTDVEKGLQYMETRSNKRRHQTYRNMLPYDDAWGERCLQIMFSVLSFCLSVTHSSPATRQCGGHASDEPRNAIAPATCPPHAADAAMVAKACPPRQTPSSHLVEGTVASKRGKSDNAAV